MKQRIIISLEPKQMAVLKRLAAERSQSMSAVVRDAVSDFTKDEEKNPAELILAHMKEYEKKYKKAFTHVDPNLSQNIDKILYGDK